MHELFGGAVARTIRAFFLLTNATFVRMLRESLVLRSMIWPGLVTCATLAVTLVIIAGLRSGRDIAIPDTLDASLIETLREADFDLYRVPDPGAEVRAGNHSLGTDGQRIWVYGTTPGALQLESIVRIHRKSRWRPVPLPPPEPREGSFQGDVTCKILALLFVLYGLVFGLGGVARDRDDGTLEAELSLPIPRWVGGFSRWTASAIIITLFYGVSVLLLGAMLPVSSPITLVLHGAAAGSGGVALGLVVVGTAGIKQGFSGPFAAGMTFATGLASMGGIFGITWLPIASLFGGGSGTSASIMALIVGFIASWFYGRRAGGR